MSRSNTANRSRKNADHAETESFFLALVCALNFESGYKIALNISKFVIYPPAAEAQFLTFDSMADSLDA